MPTEDTNDLVRQALERGFSIIPVNRDKRPRFSWKAFQERRATAEEVRKWASSHPPAWAVIGGAVSKIVILDFDGEDGLRTLERLKLSPHVTTGSGGAHVYFKHPGWPVRTLNSKSKHLLGERYPGTDI